MAMKNRCKITIKGLNQERALNILIKKLNIYNYKRESDKISNFEVDYKDRKLAKKLLIGQNLEVLSFSNHGLVYRLKKLLTSYGIISGLILSVLGYIVQYNFIFSVKVFGFEKQGNKQVERFVQGSLSTRLKSQIDTKKLENNIRNRFGNISSVSVAIIGQSLVINLNEAQIPEEMQTAFSPLISEYDAMIKSINLVQGTLAIDEGDVVKKGDVLVYPYIIDSQGEKREVKPKAEIVADVWMSGDEICYDYSIKKERTGKKVELNEIFLNSLLIHSNNKQISFDQFECDVQWKELSRNNILPLKLKTTTYYEVQLIERKTDFLSIKDDLIENARKKALIFLNENEIIKEESYTIKEGSGWHQISYVITASRNIGG